MYKTVVETYGKDILQTEKLNETKKFIQHANVSVYEHSYAVAIMCVRIAVFLPFRVDVKSLVRGALLHDYFLYDWHIADNSHKWHGFKHANTALLNACRDFELNEIEKNMIKTHMFPLNIALPKYRESVILCIADKMCAAKETAIGILK